MRLVRYTYPSQRTFAPASAFSRTPWLGLENEIARLFDSAVADTAPARFSGSFPVDVYQDKENAYVRAELPGVNRDAINLEVSDGVLTLEASRKQGEGESPETVTFKRTLNLSDEVQGDQIRATYENGVLTVTLPRKEAAKPKKINIQVG
ncbi:MAG TPA: Hsp20/alpha crystallin family protein [Opitutaceae bacterium]|nr:Hsp20/alpha crystallin family protein [Opitutaceae bacterium]